MLGNQKKNGKWKKVNQEKNQHNFSTEFQPGLEVNFAKKRH